MDKDLIVFPDNNNNSYAGGFGGPWGGGVLGFILGMLIGNNGLFGNGFGGNMGGAAGYLSQQLGDNSIKELVLQAVNGTDADVRQLATSINADFGEVRNAINTINNGIMSLTASTGMGFLDVKNSILNGNAALSRQLCECCCENRQLTMEQGYQAQIRTLEQTNQLGSQADRNTNSIVGAIQNQSTMITKEFCDAKERGMQNTIDELRLQVSDLKAASRDNAILGQVGAMIGGLQQQLTAIKGAMPQTITLPFSQYSVVPSFYAQAGADFVASYWANRLADHVGTNNTTTTQGA